jgi:hypothetical protein
MATNSKSGTGSNDNKASGGQSGARGGGGRLSRNPNGALIGGFAVGAVLGLVIPASERERAALQPVGAKLTDAARTAAREAAERGRDKLNQVTGEAVTQVGAKLVDAVAPKEA